MATAPVGNVLKWVLWKFIAIVRGRLSLGWGYVGALQNEAQGTKCFELKILLSSRLQVCLYT
jgi:hypothetical protein